MPIPRREKETLDLPRDCGRLDISICEHKRIGNRCKIEKPFLSRARCVPNQEFLLNKDIYSQEFKDFADLDEENIDEEMLKRDEFCKNLSKSDCVSDTAKIFGCQYSNAIFKKGECGLAKKIVEYYYDKSLYCVIKDCNERKEPGYSLCTEHLEEFKYTLNNFMSNYDSIMKKENIEEEYDQFIANYKYLTEFFDSYIAKQPATLVNVIEKFNEVRNVLDAGKCQCINISDCVGEGAIGDFCQKKAIPSEIGKLCNVHKKCFLEKKKEFRLFKANYQNLCKVSDCKKELKKLNEFYRMIVPTTEGDSLVIKNEVAAFRFILNQYLEEIKNI